MPRKRNKPVRLSAGDRQKLRAMLKGGRAPARELTRARILLKADEGEIESGAIHDSRHGPERTLSGKAWPDTKIADALEVSRSTVARVRERFVAGGMEAALRHRHLKRHTTKNLDGVLQVAHLIALACSAPTSRGDRCGIRLLADRGMTSERANNPPSGELVGHALILALPASARKTQGESPTSHTSPGCAPMLVEPDVHCRIFADKAALLILLQAETRKTEDSSHSPSTPHQPLVDPLSERELEVLQLIAQGLSNQEISERLFLALDTVKGHNRRIFRKLQVRRRTQAVGKARSLNILYPPNQNNTPTQH